MIKVGLIGCGFMGAMHANCYKNIEGVELVALVFTAIIGVVLCVLSVLRIYRYDRRHCGKKDKKRN